MKVVLYGQMHSGRYRRTRSRSYLGANGPAVGVCHLHEASMQQPRRTPAMYPLGAQARAASASLTDPVQVVLVERDRMARLGLSQVLAVAGMRVTGAVGLIREAEHLPASTAADVVLTGADVPDIDDMEGIGRLLTRFSRARVVVLSSDESPTLIAAAVRNGADGFLSRDIPRAGARPRPA